MTSTPKTFDDGVSITPSSIHTDKWIIIARDGVPMQDRYGTKVLYFESVELAEKELERRFMGPAARLKPLNKKDKLSDKGTDDD